MITTLSHLQTLLFITSYRAGCWCATRQHLPKVAWNWRFAKFA